ncbi:MAG: DUF4157 domain-containing protein [Alphaproteobacteria bacterium]
MLLGRMARPLTAGEIAALRPVFGDELNYPNVRIHRGAGLNLRALIAHLNGNPAIALGRHIHIAAAHYRDDYAGDLNAFAGFIAHEAVHVWQWTKGRLNPVRYLWQYWTWLHHGYDIRAVTAESRFDDLGYDQQAEAVRLYVLGDVARLGPVLTQRLPL